ncbi:MAG: TetR/AcrR family transcriptional regulator [Myxococcales bacterium]|nr:TetR/AcrR family transcriptional regulator [Myxococcales bacterium]
MTASDDARARILRASIELVRERGVRAVSFREVARRAGVSHQTPYHHFGNHQGILRAIADEGFAKLADAMAAASASAGSDALDRLTAGGVAYVLFALDNVAHFRVMFDHTLVEGPASLEVFEGQRTYGVLLTLAHGAHAAGHGASMTAEELTAMSWSMAHGAATLLTEGALTTKRQLDAAGQRALASSLLERFSELLRSV